MWKNHINSSFLKAVFHKFYEIWNISKQNIERSKLSTRTFLIDHRSRSVFCYLTSTFAKSDQANKLYVTTYANFSPNGEEIIQNLGGEHVYIYNLKNGNSDTLTSVSSDAHKNGYCKNGLNHRKVVKHKNGYSKVESYTYAKRKLFKEENSNNNSAKTLTDDLPKLASSYKLHGNDAFSQENYYQAIRWYDKALKLSPYSSVLLANKAAALLKRGWYVDLSH